MAGSNDPCAGSNNTLMIDNKEIKKTKGNYCFPNFLGKAMASVGPRVQFEASLISITFILMGIIVMGSVTIFGTDLSTFIKVMTGVNCLAAFLFLSSSLVTTFQQYQAYLSVMGIMETSGCDTEVDNIDEDKSDETEAEIEVKKDKPNEGII